MIVIVFSILVLMLLGLCYLGLVVFRAGVNTAINSMEGDNGYEED